MKKIFTERLILIAITAAALVLGTSVAFAGNFASSPKQKSVMESVSDETELVNAVNNAENGTEIKLGDNIELTSALVIPQGKEITLDLAGFTLSRDTEEKNENGSVIIVSGGTSEDMPGAILTIKDSGENGTVSGGNAVYGGGVEVKAFAKLTVEGGTIENNSASLGGGVYVDGGTFVFAGGIIQNNSGANGGGVFVSANSTFTMTDGVIKNNIAEANGGGLYIVGAEAKPTVLKATGGDISGNIALSYGGGVFANCETMILGGNIEISGNLAGTEENYSTNDFCLYTGKTVMLENADEMNVGIITYKKLSATDHTGLIAENADETAKEKLFLDRENEIFTLTDGKLFAELTGIVKRIKNGNVDAPYPVFGIPYDAVLFDTVIPEIDSGTAVVLWKKADGTWSEEAPEGVIVLPDGRVICDGSLDAGEYDFRITNGKDTDSPEYVYRDGTLVIEKADCTVEKAPQGKKTTEYSGKKEKLVSEGTVTGGTVYYKLDDTWSTDIPEATEIGNYTVYYYIKADNDHNDLGSEDDPYGCLTDIAIVKKTIAAPEASETVFTYNGSEQTYDIMIPDGVKLAGDSESAIQVNAGTYVIKLALEDEEHTQWIENAATEYNFVIERKEISVEWSDTVQEYDGTPKKPVATVNNKENDDDVTAVINTAFTDAGNGYIIAVDELAGDDAGNYVIPEEAPSTAFEITPAGITSATLKKNCVVYTGDPFSVEISQVKSGNAVITAEDYEFSGDITATEIGDYVLTVSGKGNYTGSINIEWYITQTGIFAYAEDVTEEYNGNAFCITVTVTEPETGAEIAYSLDGTEYSSEIPQFTDAGEYTVYYKVTALKFETFTGSAKVTITKAESTVSNVPVSSEPVYTGTDVALLAPGVAEGGTLLYSFLPDSEFSDSIPTGIEAGKYIVYYMVSGDKNHNDSVVSSVEANIYKADAAFEAEPAAEELTYNGLLQKTVLTGSTSDGMIEYSLDGDVWAYTVPEAVISGDYTIFYRIKGDKNHNDGEIYSVNVTVKKAALTVTATANEITFGDAPSANGVTYEGFVNGEDEGLLTGDLEFEYDYEQFGNVGKYTIVPYGLLAQNYEIIFEGGILEVLPRPVEAEWDNLTFIYDGIEHIPSATIKGALNGDTVDAITDGSKINAGTYIAYVTGVSDSNYTLAEKYETEFVINKAKLTVTANPNSVEYGSVPTANGVIYEGFVNGEDETVLHGILDYNYSYSQFMDVGEYTVTPSGLTSDNYDIEFVYGVFSVVQRPLSFEWYVGEYVYNGEVQMPTVTLIGIVNEDVCTATVLTDGIGAGERLAEVTELDNENYSIGTNSTCTFMIQKTELTVKANDASIVFGENAVSNGAICSGFVNEESENDLSGELSFGFDYKPMDNVGEYMIMPEGLTSDNYSIAFIPGTLTVTPKKLELQWAGNSFVYNGKYQSPKLTVKGLAGSDTSDIISVSREKNVGRYTASATLLSGNYTMPENVTFDFTITKAKLTVKAGDNTITYGDAPSAGKLICLGLADNDTENSLSGRLDYDFDYMPFDDVGTYKITPRGLTSQNYNITFENGILTVLPKTLNIVWGNTEFIYDGRNHIPTAVLTGTVNRDECNMLLSGEASSAGEHVAAVTTLLNPNYALPDVNTVTYIIKQAPLFITAKPATIVFGEAPEGNGVEYVGFVNGETGEVLSGILDYEFTYKRYGNVGEYQVTPYGLTSENYELIFFPNILNVVKAPVTIRVDDKSSAEGEGLSKLTFTVENGRLYNKDADGVILKKTGTDDPGRYTITATFANGNYDTTVIDGIYTVKQKNVLTNETELTVVSNKGEDPRAIIMVEKLDPEDFANVDLFDVAGDNAEIKLAYNITMEINEQTVQPESRLTVTVPIPEELQTDIALKVICIDENGKAINMNAKRGVNEIEFTTQHLSVFAVVGTKNYVPLMILAIGSGALLTAGVGVASSRFSKPKKTKRRKNNEKKYL